MDKEFHEQITLPDVIGREDHSSLPSSIGPYSIERLIKKGGMGLLYLGRDKSHHPVALKVLPKALLSRKDIHDRFLQEAKMLSTIHHPHIVKLYDQGEWEGGLYMAMEYIEGESLLHTLKRPLSLQKALEITLQILSTLEHLHHLGIIHRDLKPENILITKKNEIKILDLGVAKYQEDSSHSTQFIGTLNYMSPEQKLDPNHVTFAADIYSLGVILYELMTGKLSHGKIDLSLVPKGAQFILEKMTHQNPLERYQTFPSVKHQIEEYLSSQAFKEDSSLFDHYHEFLETLQKTQETLSFQEIPSWPEVEIGYAKEPCKTFSSYADFFTLKEGEWLMLLLEPLHPGLQGALETSWLKGILQTKMDSFSDPLLFLQELNQIIFYASKKFTLSFLLLNPSHETFLFTNCGPYFLLHYSEGQHAPRRILSDNPPLGSHLTINLDLSSGNWKPSDLLLFSNFTTQHPETLASLEKAFLETLELSVQNQANKILSLVPSLSKFLFIVQKF